MSNRAKNTPSKKKEMTAKIDDVSSTKIANYFGLGSPLRIVSSVTNTVHFGK